MGFFGVRTSNGEPNLFGGAGFSMVDEPYGGGTGDYFVENRRLKLERGQYCGYFQVRSKGVAGLMFRKFRKFTGHKQTLLRFAICLNLKHFRMRKERNFYVQISRKWSD